MAKRPATEEQTAEPSHKRTLIRAVYGLTINPTNETRFNTDAATPAVIDSWTQMQIDAGKLEVLSV